VTVRTDGGQEHDNEPDKHWNAVANPKKKSSHYETPSFDAFEQLGKCIQLPIRNGTNERIRK